MDIISKMDGRIFAKKIICKCDFVVLKHQGQLIFDVLIFDPTACERESPSFTQSTKLITSSSDVHADNSSSIPKKMKVQGMKRKQQQGDKVPSNEKVRFKPSGHPHWLAVNKSGYLTWGGMPIPKAFAGENGLKERSCEMVLLDEKGKSWPMTLRHANSSGTTYIGCWRRFHEAIGLNIGDHLVFELLDNEEKPVIKFHRNTKALQGGTAKSCSEDGTPKTDTHAMMEIEKTGWDLFFATAVEVPISFVVADILTKCPIACVTSYS